MSYSIVSILALILNQIINWHYFQNVRHLTKEQRAEKPALVHYSRFLNASNCYFVADILWGILYEHHDIDGLFPVLYFDCVLYFFFMFLSMLTWFRYLVAYLNKRGLKSKLLLYAVWAMFSLGILYLLINYFRPFIFSFDAEHAYVAESGRHIAFILQIALYMVTSTYMFYIAHRSNGAEKVRYVAVGLTCLVMELFQIFQILDPKYPAYATGLMIGICVIHSFVEAGEMKKNATFTRIAESLAANYDVIYYVDAKDSDYVSYECRNIYGKLDVQASGDDFFADNQKEIPNIVHKSDLEPVLEFIDRDHVISTLRDRKSCSLEYRIMAGPKVHYVRMTIRKTVDDTHFIIGIENIDDEVKKEKQHLRALNTEKELARRDNLTGVKNKTAYNEMEKSVQEGIDSGMKGLSFALVVCDSNNLKKTNDTLGHVAGDEYLRQSAMLLCDVFDHSPVFRVGGDEFAVYLHGKDYSNRVELMKQLRDQVEENLRAKEGPVLASGMAEFVRGTDSTVSGIFDRADHEMYEDKQRLKNEENALDDPDQYSSKK
ncbi:MAG: GGDEF domain-containing protein [Lachnospiraceae bacterium]|nr:GGDEF domain-containing protein [Lachnospiraceae bacterium]